MPGEARMFLPPETVLHAMQRPDNLIAFDWVVGWRWLRHLGHFDRQISRRTRPTGSGTGMSRIWETRLLLGYLQTASTIIRHSRMQATPE